MVFTPPPTRERGRGRERGNTSYAIITWELISTWLCKRSFVEPWAIQVIFWRLWRTGTPVSLFTPRTQILPHTPANKTATHITCHTQRYTHALARITHTHVQTYCASHYVCVCLCMSSLCMCCLSVYVEFGCVCCVCLCMLIICMLCLSVYFESVYVYVCLCMLSMYVYVVFVCVCCVCLCMLSMCMLCMSVNVVFSCVY